MFDLARIAATGLVGRIDFHESLGSTSDRALALAAEGETRLPLLVVCERQTAGRGRGTNRWWSSSGGLTFSLALEAPLGLLPMQHWPQVSLVAGLAVCEAIHSLAPSADLRVKWPNDVYLSGRKLCGILSESVPGWRDRLVIGIGINVNNQFEKRKNLRTKEPKVDATSTFGSSDLRFFDFSAAFLIDHDGLARDLTNVLIAVLDQFDRRWNELLNGGFERARAAYRERCFLTGKTVTIEQPGESTITGVCGGIGDRGALKLHTQHGEQIVASGTVVRWDSERA